MAALEALLYLAPAVLLVVVLLAGRYPGAELLDRLACPRRRRRRPRGRAARPRVGPSFFVETELAWSIAGRGPPALAGWTTT
jgi:hypothetical protein